jgi:transposase
VIILNANPNADALHPDAIYRLNIDNDGDLLTDVALSYVFSKPQNGKQTFSVFLAKGAESRSVEAVGKKIVADAEVSFGPKPNIVKAGDYTFFAGSRSDAFFFDFDGIKNLFDIRGKRNFTEPHLEHVPPRLNRGILVGRRIGDSTGIDSLLGGGTMPKAYSGDMRERVIAEVESGASRREAAEEFEVSASTAIIWVRCFRETGRCAAKPRGGSTSPLEKHADFLLGLIEERPDLTLDEVVLAMRKHKIAGSRTAVWRFFKRHKMTFKKKPAGGGAGAHRRGASTPALDARTGHV